MKRIAVLLVLLLAGLSLYGCGMKEKTASSDGGNSTSNPGGDSNVTFTLNLVDNAARFVSAGSGASQTPTDVRVVIRSFATVTTTQVICDYDENDNPSNCHDVQVSTYTEVYKDIQDVPYLSGTISVGIPAGIGYTLDVITSDSTAHSGTQSILKYGQVANVDVPGTGSATVVMRAIYDILNMKVADSITSKGKFDVTLNNVLPFANSYKMTMTFNGTPATTSVVSSSTNTTTFTAPASYSTGATLAFQGQFTVNRSFLNSSETSAKWTRLFPDAAYGESAYGNFNPLVSVTLPGI